MCKTVDDVIKKALNSADDEDMKTIVRNLSRLLRSPAYQDLDPGRESVQPVLSR